MSEGEEAVGRSVLRIGGKDRETFLQGLVSNDVRKLAQGPVYAAFLTPQGKYLADFLLIPEEDSILLDVKDSLAEALARRLAMYRLRADVTIAPTGLHVLRGLSDRPADGWDDPRHPALGWRAYRETAGGPGSIDWDAIRVAHVIPESGIELLPDDSYILEAGLERLQGVDFRKGCYVGQEVTARMKHKTELRKGLRQVSVRGETTPGTPVTLDGREVGTIYTQAGNKAIALLRLDRVGPGMVAGQADVAVVPADDAAEGPGPGRT